MSEKIIRACAECGAEFRFKGSRPNQLYCALTCSSAFRRREKLERAADPVIIEERRIKRAQITRRYVARNAAKAKAATKEWRDANRDHYRALGQAWRRKNLVRALVMEAKARAKKRGIEFSIVWQDVPPIGSACPLLGYPFTGHRSGRSLTSPSLDRINPKLGYVKGNVWIVGYRANLIKNDGTAEEHESIARAMRAHAVDFPSVT